MPRPKRIYRRDWKPQTRSIRGSVSLPRLHLTSAQRPFFECPTCFAANDRVPVCLWCKATSPASAAAFWASMPKQRTVSAPMKVALRDMQLACAPARTRSAETVSRPLFCPPMSPVSSRASSPGAKSRDSCGVSPRTSATTDTPPPTPPKPAPMPRPMPAAAPPTPPAEGRFHTLPLRRKGHILRTTGGVVVHKTRLSALFRKDAVPVLDKPPAPAPPRRARRGTPALPTIPAARPLDVPPPAEAVRYTVPTPPSFLSPFWYRPEGFARLPSPPASRAASLDTPRPARSRHAHSRSEPFAAPPPPPPPEVRPHQAWKRRMSGFFRHSVSVVTGHKAVH